jgi:predicted PurR-regulated permease PerM
MPSSTVRSALVIIAIVAAGGALYWLRNILTPLALALFLMTMIDGLARGVRKVAPFISESAALPAALVLIVVLFMGAAWVIADGMQLFTSHAAKLLARLDVLVRLAAHLLRMKAAPTFDGLLSPFYQPAAISNAANVVGAVLAATIFVLIYLGFLMASRAGFQRKAAALFAKADLRQEARIVITRIRDGVETYVWMSTMSGLMIAIPAFILMMIVGLENAAFWAFVIFLFNFVPIIGGIIAVLGPALFALVQFSGYTQAAILLIGLPVILLIVGNIIFPRMQAKSQNIDPVVVLLGFAFWGALWGATGAFLSTPLTVMAIAICAEFPGARWVAVLLSADGQPYPDVVEPPAQPRQSLIAAIRKKIIQF